MLNNIHRCEQPANICLATATSPRKHIIWPLFTMGGWPRSLPNQCDILAFQLEIVCSSTIHGKNASSLMVMSIRVLEAVNWCFFIEQTKAIQINSKQRIDRNSLPRQTVIKHQRSEQICVRTAKLAENKKKCKWTFNLCYIFALNDVWRWYTIRRIMNISMRDCVKVSSESHCAGSFFLPAWTLMLAIWIQRSKRQQMITTDSHDSMLNLNHAPDSRSIRTHGVCVCACYAVIVVVAAAVTPAASFVMC